MVKIKDDTIKMRVYKKDKERIKAVLKTDEDMTSFIMAAALKVVAQREFSKQFEDELKVKSIDTDKKLIDIKNKMNHKHESPEKWYRKLLQHK